MDLFSPVVDEKQQHPGFNNIFVPRNRFALDILNDWARGFIDRDGKFVKEFQTTFDSSFWELYIFAVLKHFGFVIDFQNSRPDFVVNTPVAFSLEATVAMNDSRTKPPQVAESSDIPNDLNIFNKEAIIRLSNSFTSKHKKFQESYGQLDHVSNKPFVLAIAPFDRPLFNMQCQRAIEALLYGYYVDEEAFIKAQDFSEQPCGQAISELVKYNGSPIKVGLFNDDQYSEISAVFFNSCATWGKALALAQDPNSRSVFTALKLNKNGVFPFIEKKPRASYSESLIDGLRIYHNPNAAHPLPKDLFRDRRVFQAYWDQTNNDWEYEQHDGQLLFRSVFTAITER